MSAAFRCDRCGTIGEGLEADATIHHEKRHCVDLGPYAPQLPSGRRDLCRGCLREFLEWFTSPPPKLGRTQ